jgi:hypothetical protein
MRVSSLIDDVYAIPQAPGVAQGEFGKCLPIRHVLCMVFLWIWEVTGAGRSYAQSASAAINGTIIDQNLARIPDARIVLCNTDKGISANHKFRVSGYLIPGNYSLHVIKDGFHHRSNPVSNCPISADVGHLLQFFHKLSNFRF